MYIYFFHIINESVMECSFFFIVWPRAEGKRGEREIRGGKGENRGGEGEGKE